MARTMPQGLDCACPVPEPESRGIPASRVYPSPRCSWLPRDRRSNQGLGHVHPGAGAVNRLNLGCERDRSGSKPKKKGGGLPCGRGLEAGRARLDPQIYRLRLRHDPKTLVTLPAALYMGPLRGYTRDPHAPAPRYTRNPGTPSSQAHLGPGHDGFLGITAILVQLSI